MQEEAASLAPTAMKMVAQYPKDTSSFHRYQQHTYTLNNNMSTHTNNFPTWAMQAAQKRSPRT